VKKLISSLIAAVFISFPLTSMGVDGGFLDISSSYVYFDSINYLKNKGVINGYPDGTFRPNNTLKRSELAKIVVISSQIPAVGERSCFPDLDPTQWYAEYVCAAKSAGLVQGYVDGTFKPSRDISRAEAIKIVAEAEDFDLNQEFSEKFSDALQSDWFYRYVNSAKSLGVLPFSSVLEPGRFITRAEFSEIYARTLKIEESNETSNVNDTQSSNPDTSVDSNASQDQANSVDAGDSNVDDSSSTQPNVEDLSVDQVEPVVTSDIDNFTTVINKDSYDNFEFDADLPTVFIKDEVFSFSGQVTSDVDFAFAVLVEEGAENKNFIAKMNENNFNIDVRFLSAGDYKLGFIAGNSGKTKVFDIEVIDSLPPGTSAVSKPQVDGAVNLGFRNADPGVFLPEVDGFKLLELKQGSRKEIFLTRQNRDFLPIDYVDLGNFVEGGFDVKVKLMAYEVSDGNLVVSQSNTVFDQEVDGVLHRFSTVDEGLIDLELPNTFTPGEQISFSFDSELDLSTTVYFIKPDGLVDTFRDGLLKAGNSYSYSSVLDEQGTYILEVNNSAGLAVINHPIYPVGSFPLVGEYFDDFESEQDGVFSESDQKAYTLALINQERAKYGFGSVTMQDDLSSLARLHGNDMIDRNYFAHVSLDGLTPNDRRVREGIATPVGENLAKDLSTLRAHRSLMRSAAHRANILNPSWDTVGISVLLDDDDYYYVVQQFSFDYDQMHDSLADELRASNVNFVDNNELEQVSSDWLDIMLESGQFGTSINGQGIFDSITAESGFVRLFSLISKATDVESIFAQLEGNANLSDISNNKFGYATAIDDDGLINFVLVFGK